MNHAILILFLLSAASAVDIVREGQPTARIILPAEATATERFAAEELRSHVERATGAELSIGEGDGARILIGRAADIDLGGQDPDAFVVRTMGDDLLLAGHSDRGTLYAVYDFLEREVGYRWLAPGPEWEFVPHLADLAVADLDRIESPAFRFRFMRLIWARELEGWSRDCLDWAVKQRVNVGAGWPTDTLSDDVVERGGVKGWMRPHDLIPNTTSPNTYAAEHPDWFALVDGQRQSQGRDVQLCTTNPEVIAHVGAEVNALLDRHPEIELLGLGQADGTAFCQCERCTALDTGELWPYSRPLPVITERWLTFVNAVAAQVAPKHPNVRLYTLAYHQTWRPPDPAVVKPEPNLMIQVVNSRPNYLCFLHRLDDPTCPGNTRFRDGFDQWADMTPAGTLVYQYLPHSTFFNMPYVAVHKFVADTRWLRDHGLVGYEAQTSTLLFGNYEVSYYAVAKAMWNPDLDPDALLTDYCRHAYGAAAGPMEAYYRTMEQGLGTTEHATDGVWPALTPAVLSAAREHLDRAHAAATDPAVKARLRVIEIGFHYAELGAPFWPLSRTALAERDAVKLREAIAAGEAAIQYITAPEQETPFFAAAPGKLRVFVKAAQNALAKFE